MITILDIESTYVFLFFFESGFIVPAIAPRHNAVSTGAGEYYIISRGRQLGRVVWVWVLSDGSQERVFG